MYEGNKPKIAYKGCIHIHSVSSDGTGNIEEISLAAKKTGLSWIIITDHNYFDLNEGIYNGVYVIKGEEVSPGKENHYVALNIKKQVEPNFNPQVFIDDVRSQGGFGFTAHPDEKVDRLNNYPPIRWNKSYIPDGVEIWNWFSCWADKLNDKNILFLVYSFLFKNHLVKKASKETLKWWDELNKNNQKIVPAIAGVDAHALKVNKYLVPVTIFPYKTMFKTLNNVVFLNEELNKDFYIAKNQILSAIKNANNIVVNRNVFDFIPEIIIQNGNKKVYSGEKINLDSKTNLVVNAGKKSTIKVLLDGCEIYEVFAQKCNLLLNKIGKYRVEIYVKNKGFVYSNPILVM